MKSLDWPNINTDTQILTEVQIQIQKFNINTDTDRSMQIRIKIENKVRTSSTALSDSFTTKASSGVEMPVKNHMTILIQRNYLK